MERELGFSGRLTRYFQSAQITPLLALVALLLGVFAVLVTPREEEPQINVTMANVLIPFPGAAVKDVEQMVAIPAEQVLAQIQGIEHVMSVSRPGLAIVTVQFKVGVPRTEALVRLHDTIRTNADWLPQGLGVAEPIIKPKGIDDVPIVTLTLFAKDGASSAFDLERVAHSMEVELKRVPGTREVVSIGGPGRALTIALDPARLAAHGITLAEVKRALQSANAGAPLGNLLRGNQSIQLEAGPFLRDARDAAELVVGVSGNRPVFLQDVAQIEDGPPPATRYVWHGVAGAQPGEYPAVTLAITKKPGENAIDVANAVMRRAEALRNTLIPAGVELAQTRNYGATANDKAKQLIQKLLFATASVVALVFIALGRREAAIVGTAVILTLTVTLFASWAWGFTLNRVSLFALIFSIGILVDDAIVVVENIHRHLAMDVSAKAHVAAGDVSRSQNNPEDVSAKVHVAAGDVSRSQNNPEDVLAKVTEPGQNAAGHEAISPTAPDLLRIIPRAIDEVGGPTILATFTVIAALLPMAFVSGLMGPYMAPIPINASMGMLLSLAIAFMVTPWLARLWLKAAPADGHGGAPLAARLGAIFERIFRPLLAAQGGAAKRRLLWFGVAALIAVSLLLPAFGWVVLKMLPFDNKSEFQVVVDMPAGTPLERTAALMQELGAHLSRQPEVVDYQAYVGVASPINFNGLVRQYYLRAGGEVGDLQVKLLPKGERQAQSHAIVTRLRPELQRIAAPYGANLKLVEVPPGPPVLSPIVAELYGPEAPGRQQLAQALRQAFAATPGVVDVDDSSIAAAPRRLLLVDRHKAALSGVTQEAIVSTLRAAATGEAAAYLHDASKYPVPALVQLPAEAQGEIEQLLALRVRGAAGQLIPIRELVTVSDSIREQPIYHKDLLPVHYVVGDMAGRIDSPLYGMFGMRAKLAEIVAPDGGRIAEHFISPPEDPYRGYALKWDGEWQITYETFRDMGAAYAVGLVLIYLLVVAQFGSYLTPLIIMAPIPLTLIGVMPGHALLGAQFTATSMIGMIALAGIIVRNSILLVDFIRLQVASGVALEVAVVRSAATRAQPILLTALAAMQGAFFILDDPIFNGLAVSLIFGIMISTLLTLVVIPLLYYIAYREPATAPLSPPATEGVSS